jgi:hypothetical protein
MADYRSSKQKLLQNEIYLSRRYYMEGTNGIDVERSRFYLYNTIFNSSLGSMLLFMPFGNNCGQIIALLAHHGRFYWQRTGPPVSKAQSRRLATIKKRSLINRNAMPTLENALKALCIPRQLPYVDTYIRPEKSNTYDQTAHHSPPCAAEAPILSMSRR